MKSYATIPIIIILALPFLISSCEKVVENKTSYISIKGKDTAFLIISTYKNRFYGTHKVYYGGKAIIDSGSVEGLVVGDTLRGKFRYTTYGGNTKIDPIIFLQKQDELIQGRGIISSYMNIPYFMPQYPIKFDDSSFVYRPLSNRH